MSSVSFYPIHKTLSATLKFNHAIIGLVSRLFCSRTPLAVSLFVISRCLDSVKARSVWPLSHVFEKVHESVFSAPSFAHRYALPAIVFVLWAICPIAPVLHGPPSVVFAGWIAFFSALAMAITRRAKTATGFNVSGSQMSRSAFVFISAIAFAKPSGWLVIGDTANNHEARKARSNKIDKFHNAVTSIRAVFKEAGSRATALNATFGVSPYPAQLLQSV